MLEVKTTSRFDRMLSRFVTMHPDLRERVRSVTKRLARNPRDTQSRDHALSLSKA